MIRTLILGGWFDASTVNGRFESSPINQTTREVAGSFRGNVVVVVGPTGATVVVVGAAVELVVDPDFFPEVPARMVLTASGHLHGGQVNLPLVRRSVLPTSYGERFLAGHVVERGRHLYVSSGLGTAGLPLRLRRPPEVPVLRLTAAAPTAPAA